MPQKYDVLLFDSDNTLFNHDLSEKTALYEAFAEYGAPITPEIHALYQKINDDVWKEYERGVNFENSPLITRFERLNIRCRLELEPVRINSIYTAALARQCFPYPDSERVCRELSQRHALYIVTNGTDNVQYARYEKSPLLPYFSGIFTATFIGIPKPTREFFERVLEKISLKDRRRALVIGDSLTSDIRGGINAEIDTCWFNPKHIPHPDDMEITYEIDRIDALLSLI